MTHTTDRSADLALLTLYQVLAHGPEALGAQAHGPQAHGHEAPGQQAVDPALTKEGLA